jgi:ABC-type nitrate/sulfonate/bicarbonate transport system substrate-binding protein
MVDTKSAGGRRRIAVVAILVVAILVVAVLLWQGFSARPSSLTPLRVGWQVSWATQGQIAQVLKHTNILEMNGFKGKLKGFSYGGPLNEAALAGEVDVIFTADQPAVSLLAAGGKWHIVGRLISFRAAIIVPVNSSTTRVADLKGKTIAIPFGSATHRIVLGMIEEAGLKPDVDVVVRNMDILEQAAVVQAGGPERWGELDALASWDPYTAIFEEAGQARVLQDAPGLSVVMVSDAFSERYQGAVERFMRSYIGAVFYYATHQEAANRWFARDSRVEFDLGVLDKAASFEPNLQASGIDQVRVLLTEDEIRQVESGARFAKTLGLIKQVPDVRGAVNQDYARAAVKSFEQQPFEMEKVEEIP